MTSAIADLPLPLSFPRFGGWMAAAVLCALLGLAAAALLATLSQEPEPVIGAKPVVRDEHEGSRTRCAGCGVVKAIRTIDGGPSAPPSYEFTIRFRDGTSRMTVAADRALWQVGDRIIVVGGAAP
ncbi:MAG TPA: hypothetical protein VEA40_03815 [Ramlibacter sp.]|nr:hypothetical protein [Ramlibacter sp.]